MARRSGLGRGLGALIPTDVGRRARLRVPRGARRGHRAEPAPAARATSTRRRWPASPPRSRELGVLQPVLVREVGDERYELIAGERRWRAAKRAGLPSIPVVVRTVDEVLSLEQALVENLHREDLNPLEEAAAYQQLIEDFELTQEAVAQKVGRAAPRWPTRCGSSSCRRRIQRLRRREPAGGRATPGRCSAPRTAPSRSALAKQIVADGLSVREAEEAVRRHNEAEDAAPEGRGRARDRQSRRGPPAAAAGAARARGAAGRPTSTRG